VISQDRGLLVKGSTRPSQKAVTTNTSIPRPRSAHTYGNANLMVDEFQDLIPIITEAFPDHWEEILALVFTRVSGYLPLKRVKPASEKLDNLPDISPNYTLKNLSLTLRAIGDDIIGQDMVFKHLSQGNSHLIYDLSFVFSLSDNRTLAEWGRNHEDIALPQVNLTLFCGLETGLPVMLRANTQRSGSD